MGVKTTVREQVENKKYVGFMEVDILPVVNPTLEQLQEMGFTYLDKEPEYLKEVDDKDKEGEVTGSVKQLAITLFFKNKAGEIFNTKFFLKDKVRWNKAGTAMQYVNSKGRGFYAESEDQLPEWFTKAGGVKEAKDGEADLVEFLANLLNKADRKKGFEVTIDNWKKLMDGNVKEIMEIIKDDSVGSLLIPLVVRTTDEGKEYQQIFNRSIVPGYYIKNLRLLTNQGKDRVKEEDVEKWGDALKKKEDVTPLQRAILKMEDREYGCSDEYFLGLAKEYVAGADDSGEETPPADGPGY